VLAKDATITMWWNPKFVAGLTPAQIKGLLKHECYHLVFEHTTTRRHEPHLIWNYATDLAINSLIVENELPEGGLVPGKAFTELTVEQQAQMGPERVKQYETISRKLESLPSEKSAEWYFSQLMSGEEVKKAIEEGNQVGGKSLADALADGDVKVDENGDLVDKDGNPVNVVPGPTDDHGGWDQLSDEERELVKGKVKQVLKDAVNECDKKGQWGSIGAETRGTLRDMISNEIPWQSVLKQFCGLSRRANRHSNVRRLSRKYPGIHPGVQKGYTASIAVYVDQSGSVSDSELELLFGELRSLAKNVQFVVYHFDTEVDESSETEWRKGKTPSTHRTRCGGTCFKAPTEHANKNKHRFDGYLILTDGGASDPGPSRLRRGWVITPGQDLYFKASNQDFVINMKQPKKENAA
jgi:predicted metal-dependent peptidase